MTGFKEPKKRKILNKDYDHLQEIVFEEFKKRKGMQQRKKHEAVWTELDRQIAMEAPKTSGDNKDDWHSTVQLGHLADALEIITADVLRMSFPLDKRWFRPHVELQPELNPETGQGEIDQDEQEMADGLLRSLMIQQQADFGFRDRVKACIKEALSHGGFACEVRTESLSKVKSGGRVQTLRAPVLIPYSMWNVFPDPSPFIMGTELFYKGSMIIRSYMPFSVFERQSQFIRKEKVEKRKAKPEDDVISDVELITYWGDITIPRSDGNIYLPNVKIILANETLVYAKENDLPYSPIIYTGYEKDSLLDPYYTSPLIKRAPTHKLATELANKFIDSAELLAEPPCYYDGYDTELVRMGGPDISPRSKTAVKGGGANIKFLDVGDPSFMYTAMLGLIQEVQQGTSVDAVRSGVSQGTEQTATEVMTKEQKGEVRSVDFLSVLDRQLLKPFLHMQHDYNLQSLDNYPFFNNEMHSPDFIRVSKDDLPENVIFDVVGSKEVLGEQQRAQKFVTAVQLSSSIEQISSQTNWQEVAQEVWHFSGIKDPEKFIMGGDDEQAALVQQFQQVIQEMQAGMQELQQEVAINDLEKEQLQSDINSLTNEIKILEETKQSVGQLVSHQARLKDTQHKIELLLKDVRNTKDKQTTIN